MSAHQMLLPLEQTYRHATEKNGTERTLQSYTCIWCIVKFSRRRIGLTD